jgi:hypothetical protein
MRRSQGVTTIEDMQSEARLNPETIERLEEQSGLLLRTYQAEIVKDPTSRATETARSNLIALKHSISQIYGESVAVDVASALGFAFVCGDG